MNIVVLRALTGAAAAALSIAAATGASAEKWDMPLAYPATNYHSETAAGFAKGVTDATGGEIEIVTHPGGSLFKGDEIFRAVRAGQAPIGERLISALSNEDPVFAVDALPFLATSFDEAWNLYQASKPTMEAILQDKGVKLLYAVAWPPQGLYTVNPVTKIADMNGVKFRAYNASTTRLAELMGAVPTQIEAADIGQAFATGVADSMISSGSTGYDMKIWEYVKYWYDTQAWLPKNMVIINLDTWNGLDEKTQAIILEQAGKAEEAGWAKARELADWYKVELAKNGMTVEPPSPELATGFKEIGGKMTEEWLVDSGDNGTAIIEAYKKM
jgi:TRAP-type transport system periplasmic protein